LSFIIHAHQAMIEVLKTDVEDSKRAVELLDQINARFPAYQVNFDLTDCDRILRIKAEDDTVEAVLVIEMLKKLGHKAERLE
jgi:hypothetical protein